MKVLVANAGSSSVKLRLLDGDELVGGTDLDADRGRVDDGSLQSALADLGDADAIGHRVVHGGDTHRSAVRLTDDVIADLRALVPLAPLQQPASLAAIETLQRLRPGLPAVACFDTAFHATLPRAASTYALPARWREELGVHRFGFHGLSYAYAARRTAELLGRDDARLVVCHLGSGASLAAVSAGVSVDTTMGFTPLEGLVMGSRAGSLDPGIVLWLQQERGLSAAEVFDGLERDSGLRGLAGDADLRAVKARADGGDSTAKAAIDVYLHVLRRHVGAMTASLGGIDALVFTGGVGEHAAWLRRDVAAGLGYLGVEVDEGRNDDQRAGDRDVASARAATRVLVVAAREDLQIAAEVRTLLGAS